MRKCRECGIEAKTEEELELFPKQKGKKYGRDTICKSCLYAKRNKKHRANRSIQKRYRVRSKYGVTLEEYEDAMSTSDVCEICGKESERLVYDHDHKMPKDITAFRGVLCDGCNLMLGGAKDNIETLLKGVEYLKRYKRRIKDDTE